MKFIEFSVASVDIPLFKIYLDVDLVHMMGVCTTAPLYHRWDGNLHQWLALLFAGEKKMLY